MSSINYFSNNISTSGNIVCASGTFNSGLTSYNPVFFFNLPTSDPMVSGQVWNSDGFLKISNGVVTTPTATPTITPTETLTVTPTETPTNTPTVTPTSSVTPTVTPTETPTVTPTNTVTPNQSYISGQSYNFIP